MDEFLLKQYYGNTLKEYLLAFGIFIAATILFKLFSVVVMRRLKRWAERTDNTLDDFVVEFLSKTVIPLLYLAVFYFSIHNLQLHIANSKYLGIAYMVIITFVSVKGLLSVTHYFLIKFITRNEKDQDIDLRIKQLKGFLTLFDFVIWTLGVVFLLSNLGYNITVLATGLGVSGIAFAIAAQAILGDFFAYFVIFFDRPFNIGDYIELDQESGTIEFIGVKSTRLRTLRGDHLIISNKDLTNARLHNHKKMERRRVVFNIGVTYQTTEEQLEAIPKLVEGVIQTVENATFDRGHFVKFAAFSLDFEFVYYCESPDFTVHINILHEVNLKIYKAFAENGVQFAYPTQLVYIQK